MVFTGTEPFVKPGKAPGHCEDSGNSFITSGIERPANLLFHRRTVTLGVLLATSVFANAPFDVICRLHKGIDFTLTTH